MIETKRLSIFNVEKFKVKQLVVGMIGLGIAGLGIAWAMGGFQGHQEIREWDMSLADPDFVLPQPERFLQLHTPVVINGVDISRSTQGEITEAIGGFLSDMRQREIRAIHGDEVFTTTLGSLGLRLEQDLDVILAEVEAKLELVETEGRPLPAIINPATYLPEDGRTAWAAEISQALDRQPQEPTMSMAGRGQFQVQEGIDGIAVDTSRLLADLSAYGRFDVGGSFELEVATVITQPQYDASILANIDTMVATFSSTFAAGGGRGHNVRHGATFINSQVIMPGETFDYNSFFPSGPAAFWAAGFQSATVFQNGRVAEAVGGGLCQVSSTLYGLLLRVGIVPETRAAHSVRVHYVPGGLDACMWNVPGSHCNVVFTNPYDAPLYLVSWAEGGRITMEFWSEEDVLDGYTFVPGSGRVGTWEAWHADRQEMVPRESWSSWIRIYRNGEFVSTRNLGTDTYWSN